MTEPPPTEGHWSVRPMTLADLDHVLEIEERSYTSPWSRSVFERELTQTHGVYFVGCLGGRIVGYIGGWTIADEVHITTVAVHPDVRGRNLSDRLLIALLRRVAACGITRATLEVRSRNRVARNLYRKYGFTEVALRRGYYTHPSDDAVVMWVLDIHRPEYENRLADAESRLRPVGSLPSTLRPPASQPFLPRTDS